DSAVREQILVTARFEGGVQEAKAETLRLGDRMRPREEEVVGRRSAASITDLEGALGKVAGHVYEGDKHAREMLETLRERVDQLDASGQDTTGAMRDLKQRC